jgi:hypothetical protein
MAQIELKEGQVNFPVQDSPNTISEPGIIPVGSKLADISAIIAPNGYRPRCTLYISGAGLRQWYSVMGDLMPEHYLFCNNDRYKLIARTYALLVSEMRNIKASKNMAAGLAWHTSTLPNLRQ